jgi:hypothetical protein
MLPLASYGGGGQKKQKRDARPHTHVTGSFIAMSLPSLSISHDPGRGNGDRGVGAVPLASATRGREQGKLTRGRCCHHKRWRDVHLPSMSNLND